MNIRVMTIEDYDGLTALWNRTPNMGLGDADTRIGIEKFLKRNPSLSFVAFEDGKLVGSVMGGHDGRKGFIYHAAVDVDYRRRGIGTQLMNLVLSALREEGITKACLLVFRKNETGNAYWASTGWGKREDLNYYTLDLSCPVCKNTSC